MPPPPRAYLITFRTYGTWLHGDGRYSINRRGAHGYQAPALAPSPRLRESSLSSMEGDPVLLEVAARAVVNATVGEVCDHRGWGLFAVNARTNHVHVVLASSASSTANVVMGTLKAWCTRRLREGEHVAPDARVWSRHGSTRYLWTEAEVGGAVRYVMEGQ